MTKRNSKMKCKTYTIGTYETPELIQRGLTLLRCEIYSFGNSKGVEAAIPVTIWRKSNGQMLVVSENPEDSALLRKMLKKWNREYLLDD